MPFVVMVNTAHKEIDLARPKENETVSGFLPEERAWIDKLITMVMWIRSECFIPHRITIHGGVSAPVPVNGMWAGELIIFL